MDAEQPAPVHGLCWPNDADCGITQAFQGSNIFQIRKTDKHSDLSDRSHKFATQIDAAQNSMALLSSAVSTVAAKPGALFPDLTT